MAIRRFYVNKEDITDDIAILRDVEHNHAKNVLRLNVGEEVVLICGDEFDYYATITEMTKSTTTLKINNKHLNAKNPKVHVSVFQAFTKNDAMTNLVVRLNELGVSEFYPMNTRYVVAKDAKSKQDKLQLQSNLSAKQCERSIPLVVKGAVDIKDIKKYISGYDIVVFANEKETTNKIVNYESEFKAASKIAVIVGCEGGFSPEEIAMLQIIDNVKSISLGKRILRVETACLSAVSVVLSIVGEI